MVFNSAASDEENLKPRYVVRVISRQRILPSLIIGFLIGFTLGYFLIILSNSVTTYIVYSPFKRYTDSRENNIFNYEFLNISKHEHIGENTILADKLYNEVKVLCWIMTSPDNHKSKAEHVKLTWGKRCNKLIFMSTEDDEELGAIGLDVNEGRDGLWNKTRAAYTYVYENHFNEYDWFLKADDDTYFIMENLRFMLSEHRNDTPIYFGSKFQMPSVVYMSGGAGYVLSREAVRRFVEIGIKNPRICRDWASTEDVEIGVCLNAVGVMAGDSRDEKGKSRFHPLSLDNHLEPDIIGHDFWLWDYSYYKFGSGLRFVSDKAISFHYLTPAEMYICEYLIYHAKPYGIWSLPEDLPEKQLTIEEEVEFLKNADNDRNLV